MGKLSFFLLLLVAFHAMIANAGDYDEDAYWGEREFDEGGDVEEIGGGGNGGGEARGEEWFMLHDSLRVVKTDAGRMRIVKGVGKRVYRSPMHIGFITMEPKSLFIPQYVDCNLILFIRTGKARVGHIYKDVLVERQLRSGDIYKIHAGSAFYIVNEAEDHRLHIISSIDTSESLRLGWHGFQSFFVGGGTYPTSVLSGFDPSTLSIAFNVSIAELREVFTRQQSGPIVYLPHSQETRPPSIWSKFLDLEEHQRLAHLRRVLHSEEETAEDEKVPTNWSLTNLIITLLGNNENVGRRREMRGKGPEPCNMYDREANYENNYGWSKAVDESDYSPLHHSGTSIYMINLTAGSMMAPHMNPTATEYGIVLRGSGSIQIVLPNGTLAMNAKVREGDVFWVPRYFPFCQIASRTGPLEIFGYTTSAHKNRPQFLVGANSLLHTMRGPEAAAAFGLDEERFRKIIDAQRSSVILPSPEVAH